MTTRAWLLLGTSATLLLAACGGSVSRGEPGSGAIGGGNTGGAGGAGAAASIDAGSSDGGYPDASGADAGAAVQDAGADAAAADADADAADADAAPSCGNQNQACCSGDTCEGSLQCKSGVCTPLLATGLAVGEIHVCAVLFDGKVKCWGNAGNGELGEVSTPSVATPVAVAGVSGAVGVSAGYAHSCAVLKSSSALCWGPTATDGSAARRRRSSSQFRRRFSTQGASYKSLPAAFTVAAESWAAALMLVVPQRQLLARRGSDGALRDAVETVFCCANDDERERVLPRVRDLLAERSLTRSAGSLAYGSGRTKPDPSTPRC